MTILTVCSVFCRMNHHNLLHTLSLKNSPHYSIFGYSDLIQECIPVGCVPPTAIPFLLPCTPLAMHSPPPPCMPSCHACPLPCMPPCHSCTPSHAHPLPCMPPASMPPATHAPLPCMPPNSGQNSWHMFVKTLPCSNFVAGGNNMFVIDSKAFT